MDLSLVAWGRAVKARRRLRLPALWLFTDPDRTPDVLGAVRNLPRGLCGVVFRPGGAPRGAALLKELAQACRQRRLALVVAGPVRGVPAGVGRHLRGGRGPGGAPLVTSSAHSRPELVRARRRGAHLVFISPAFETASHPGRRPLGAVRWGLLAGRAGVQVAALGGVGRRTVRRLPPSVRAAGAIGALLP